MLVNPSRIRIPLSVQACGKAQWRPCTKLVRNVLGILVMLLLLPREAAVAVAVAVAVVWVV